MADHAIRQVLQNTLVRLHLAPDEEAQRKKEQSQAAQKAFQANLDREQRLLEQERVAMEQATMAAPSPAAETATAAPREGG